MRKKFAVPDDMLLSWGWDTHWQEIADQSDAGLVCGRVVRTGRNAYNLVGTFGEALASVAGTLGQDEKAARHLPAVGDWVAVDPVDQGRTTIRMIFPRRTEVKRVAAGNRKKRWGGSRMQVLAANVNRLLIVFGLDRPWSEGSLERYLTMAVDSGALPVVVLNKQDLCDDAESCRLRAVEIVKEYPVLLTNADSGEGVEALLALAEPGATWALIGPSGAGKSTLLNCMGGSLLQRTAAISTAVGKGRHTTTEREMYRLPNGLILIDNPGLRELQVQEAAVDLQELYGDIEVLGASCRFRDCRHNQEPDCAVLAAVRAGELDAPRVARYKSWCVEQQQAQHKARRQ